MEEQKINIEKMTKELLGLNSVVETRNGERFLVLYDKDLEWYLLSLNEIGKIIMLSYYDDDLFTIYRENKYYDIMKVNFALNKVYQESPLVEVFRDDKWVWIRNENKKSLLTEDEKAILRNLPKEYKWITRDRDGNLFIFVDRPFKDIEYNYWNVFNLRDNFEKLNLFKNLFRFITWEDKQPYNIEELLGE